MKTHPCAEAALVILGWLGDKEPNAFHDPLHAAPLLQPSDL